MKYALLEYAYTSSGLLGVVNSRWRPHFRLVRWPLVAGPRRVTELYIHWRSHQWRFKWVRQ